MKCIVRNITAHVSTHPSFDIDQISFALSEGQILAILGASGAGKTSLLNALAGFLPVQHGAIILDDKTVSCASFCLSPQERNIGIIFQDQNVLPHLSLFENITLGLEKEYITSHRKEIQDLLGDLHIDHVQDNLPSAISGGQQQRIALGRALLHNKKLLLFDEPFSGLDTQRMYTLARTIRSSVQKYKRIAILVTHHIEEAFLIADAIGIMDGGRLLQVTSPEDIYHSPQTVEIARSVGPLHMLAGTRKSTHQVQTDFGLTKTVNTLSQDKDAVSLLTRPDDYTIQKGGDGTVVDVLFMGMSKLISVKKNDSVLQVAVDHHHDFHVNDQVHLTLNQDHPYIAYDSHGRRI